jgi:hypothetical protein
MLTTLATLAQISTIFVVLYAPSDSGPMTSHAWDCSISSSQICSEAECINKMAVNRLIIRPQDFLYARCVGDTCESYPASFGPMANSTVVTIAKSSSVSAMVRIRPDLSFTETLGGANQIVTSFGKCKEVNAPPILRMK